VKLSHRYNPEDNLWGMVPRARQMPRWADFKQMDLAYWMVLATVASAFIAGLEGFLALLVNPDHPLLASHTLFSGYLKWLGGAEAAFGNLVGSHSHTIGIALLVGTVAVIAKRFNVLSTANLSLKVAKLGMWVSIVGITIMTIVYILESFSKVWPGGVPPSLFAFNAGGPLHLWSSTAANGMAGDDATMMLASLGAAFLFVPLLLQKFRNKPTWRDPLRMGILATWVVAYIATPLEGFYIEFHAGTMAGGAKDVVFGQLQYYALFGILMVTLAFLAIDFCQEHYGAKKWIARGGIIVLLFSLVSGFVYAFLDAGSVNKDGSMAGLTTAGTIFAVGLLAISVVVVAAMLVLQWGEPSFEKGASSERLEAGTEAAPAQQTP
jgi:hypothetical protein